MEKNMETTLKKIKETYAPSDQEILLKAYAYAEEAHANQKRASGEPYFIHPCAVAEILMDLGLDAATIAAALLHDVIEDTEVTAEDIKDAFGEEVLTLVASVTKLEKIVFKSKEEENAENFRKIFVAMAKDVRVIIIKLADACDSLGFDKKQFIFALRVFEELGLVAFADGRLIVYRGQKAELTDSSVYRKVCALQSE